MDIRQISYPDFVGVTGQENTPPGGRRTVHRWIDAARIDRNSFVLDLACTTGFSGREVHADTGARVHGIDLSESAISMARQRAQNNEHLSYQVADAARLPFPDASFTHILGGCNFGFIQERERARAESARVLRPGGKLCVASLYYVSTPPDAMLDKVEDTIGYRPSAERDQSYWQKFFGEDFELEFDHRERLRVYRPGRITRAVRRSIARAPGLRHASRDDRQSAFERLEATRMVLNEHRRFQALLVAVWTRCER